MIQQSTLTPSQTPPLLPPPIPPIKFTPNPLANCSPQSKSIQQKYINKFIRVTTLNGRVFYGEFKILDNFGNILLSDAIAQCSPETSCPINDTLYNWLDDKMRGIGYLRLEGVAEEERKKVMEEFLRNKYYMAVIMLRADDIQKVEIQG